MASMTRHPVAIAVLGMALLASWVMRNELSGPRVKVTRVRVTQQPDSAQGVALLKRAIKLNSEEQHAAAVATYDSAAVRLPQIADWISIFSAASTAFRGDTLEVARRLATVDTALTPQWGWRARARAFTVAGVRIRALEVARGATNVGTAANRADAWFRVAELNSELGNARSERVALLRALQVTPESDAALKAALVLAEKPRLTIEEQLQVGRSLMRNGEITRGVRVLERALATGKVTERSQLRYELGRVLFGAGRYADAIRHLRTVASGYSQASNARFLLGRARYRNGLVTEGKQTLRSVVTDYPTSQAATRALFLLADLAQDDGDVDDAAALFERAAAAPAKVDATALALMRRGAIAFLQADYARAATIFDAYRTRYPSGEYHSQATYWAAQTALRRGNEATGKELLRALRSKAPLSYYGLRAAEVLDTTFEPSVPAGPQPSADAHARINAGLNRWGILREVGWNAAANYELSRVRASARSDTNALYSFAEELNARGASHMAISAGRELLTRFGWNRRLLKIMYPLPYLNIIEREARAHGLDPYFVAALIRQESSFNRNAKSGAGAIGLMQVMPATGRALARNAGVGSVTAETLTDPTTNIKLGTRFLADQVREYGNRLDVVLVAYNAGPTRAQRWRSFPEISQGDLFVERIPFDETRQYVKIVTLNAAIYRSLYANQRTGD
jgi:soluble lytic murein transglycosylase